MLAPSSSRSLALVVLVAALVAAGCTVPGSSRLQGTPEDLPPSLHHVTADVLGFTLFDTDRADIEALGLPGEQDRWIGKTAGIAIRELQLDADDDPATLAFADVEDGEALHAALGDSGWLVAEDTGDEGEPTEWERRSGARRALATYDDAVIVASSRDELDRWVRMADDYAVADRKAMREYAVEARDRVGVSFVYRFDLLRTQLRRPFQDDPALLEFARWATDSNMLVALRDGWLGIAPPLDGEAGVRIVGAGEWVPDLAPDIDLEPVDRRVLDELPPGLSWMVALHDPGQQLRELVRAITYGAGQYVTGQDVEGDEEVELLPVLDALDGDAAIGGVGRYVEAYVEGGDAGDVNEALETAGIDGRAEAEDGALRIAIGSGAAVSTNAAPARIDVDDAGKPPRPPVFWLRTAAGGCLGPAAGWITWDGTDELRTSIAASVPASGACAGALVSRTITSLGVTSEVRPRA